MGAGPNNSRWWVWPAVVASLLGIALIQGMTIQEIGIPGALSVKLAPRESGGESASQAPAPGGGAENPAPDPDPGPVPEQPGPGPSPAVPQPPTTQPVVGSWVGERGDIRVEVTRVENQDRHLRIDATVTNGTDDSVSLFLFGNVTAVDESGRSYEADPFASDWVETVARGLTTSGTIEFEGVYEPGAGTLTLSFARVGGFDAPSGGLNVPGITRP